MELCAHVPISTKQCLLKGHYPGFKANKALPRLYLEKETLEICDSCFI